MMAFVSVGIKELGTNCWMAKRLCGGRCPLVHVCKYPERHDCEAVKSEIARLKTRSIAMHEVLAQQIKQLEAY